MPTIKEIAEHTNLSISTVSVVLRGEGDERKIAKSTQDSIWKSAKELGYKPNIAARRLRSNYENPFVIGVFWTSDFRAHMLVRFLHGLQEAVLNSKRKCEILVHPYINGALRAEPSLQGISSFNAAIICNASNFDMDFLENTKFNIPIVLYNRTSDQFCTVNINDQKLGSIPAEVFASRGHKTSAILTSTAVFPGMSIRTDSFIDTCRTYNIEVKAVIRDEFSLRGGYQGGRDLCSLGKLPDCLFCASDDMAFGALRAFSEAGIQIPRDIEIISVGNGDSERQIYSYPSLSVVHLPMEDMAKSCLTLILDLLDLKIEAPNSIELPIRYIQRESCKGSFGPI